jgi:DNA-directed RNA polymerase specialized sigma24 family protein
MPASPEQRTGPPRFDERFDALSAIAYRVAYRLLGNREDAREVAQEALARAYARWRKVAGHDEPWVARVATNLAIGRWRKRRPTVPVDARSVLQRFGADVDEEADTTGSDQAATAVQPTNPTTGLRPC